MGLDWLTRMNRALDMIENNLSGELELGGLAKEACSSPFHFQRMFSALTGCTLAEYIRRRRLTLAAQELALSDIKVVDAALKYGYGTPEAFAKAFRKTLGVTPSMAKRQGSPLIAFPKLSFHLSLKGDVHMNYRIEKKEAFHIAGASIEVGCADGENFRRIPLFWQESGSNGMIRKVASLQPDRPIMGACVDLSPDTDRFRYMIAVEAPAGTLEADKTVDGVDFVEREIPASTWAVFTAVGQLPDSIQSVTRRIYSDWFPSSGYEHAGTADLEIYLEDGAPGKDSVSEIWVPLKKAD
ncbi:helix-turn-helix domain-containing protein [Paenibacillus sp. RUD330]|nr:helix-turn-helix domain-containing protein [Paenibacillus sp. RUD330]